MRELVFVHGRSQQHKNATALKQEWVTSFIDGLQKSGLTLPIPDTSIRFPYYGDTLAGLVDGLPPDQIADVIVRGDNAGADERAFELAIVREIGERAGLTDEDVREIAGDEVVQRGPLNWGWLRAILSAIDTHVPLGSGASIALFTKDVYQYLRNPGIRDRIESGVRQALSTNPTVVVAHSLGSVVAYNLLTREGDVNRWNVPRFVTVGCPLAVTAISSALRPHMHPSCAKSWFNAMDDRDIVALYPLDAAHAWGVDPAIANKTDVKNPTPNRHGISGYLSDAEVARQIHDALGGSD